MGSTAVVYSFPNNAPEKTKRITQKKYKNPSKLLIKDPVYFQQRKNKTKSNKIKMNIKSINTIFQFLLNFPFFSFEEIRKYLLNVQ